MLNMSSTAYITSSGCSSLYHIRVRLCLDRSLVETGVGERLSGRRIAPRRAAGARCGCVCVCVCVAKAKREKEG